MKCQSYYRLETVHTYGHEVILVSEERAHPGSQWDSGRPE